MDILEAVRTDARSGRNMNTSDFPPTTLALVFWEQTARGYGKQLKHVLIYSFLVFMKMYIHK